MFQNHHFSYNMNGIQTSQVITEEVPCGFFLRTVIVNRGNSCELKLRKKRSFLASMARFISVFESFETYKPA